MRTFPRGIFGVFFLSLALFTGACTRESSLPSQERAEWTIFVYGHADHNLSNSMLIDLREMEAANLSSQVRVIAAIDYDSSQDMPGTTGNYPDGTVVYEILGGGQSRVIATYPEQNFDDVNVMVDLAQKAFTQFPSKRRGLVLWDHGGAWDGGYGGDTQNGTVRPTSMTVADVKSAVTTLLGKIRQSKFDFLAFDTCLMGNLEVAFELKDLAQYFFASAEIDFGPGWDYTAALNSFVARPTADVKTLAPEIIAGWDAHHRTASVPELYLRTQMGLETAKLDKVAASTAKLTSALVGGALGIGRITQQLTHSNPTYGTGGTYGRPSSYRDAGHFLRMLKVAGDANVAAAADEVLRDLGDAIMASTLGTHRDGVQIGLSIEGGIGEAWNNYRRAMYNGFQWKNATNWSSVLDKIRENAEADHTPPTVTTTVDNPVATTGNPPTVEFTVVDADADQAMVYLYSRTSPAFTEYLGVVGHGFVNNGDTYQFPWDGKRIVVSNGTTTSPVAVEFSMIPGLKPDGSPIGGFYRIRGFLQDGATEYLAFLLMSPDEDDANNVMIVDTNGQVGSVPVRYFAQAGGATFTPVIRRTYSAGGSPLLVRQTPIAISPSTTTLQILEQDVALGEYVMATSIHDIWDNSGAASDVIDVQSVPF